MNKCLKGHKSQRSFFECVFVFVGQVLLCFCLCWSGPIVFLSLLVRSSCVFVFVFFRGHGLSSLWSIVAKDTTLKYRSLTLVSKSICLCIRQQQCSVPLLRYCSQLICIPLWEGLIDYVTVHKVLNYSILATWISTAQGGQLGRVARIASYLLIGRRFPLAGREVGLIFAISSPTRAGSTSEMLTCNMMYQIFMKC